MKGNVGRPKKVRIPVIEPDEPSSGRSDASDGEEYEAQDEQLAKIATILENNSLKDGDVIVLRKTKSDIKSQFCGTVPTDEFEVGEVIGRFGGGRYTFKFRNSDKQFVTQGSLDVDPRLKGTIDDAPTPATIQPVADSKDVMGVLMTMLAQSQQAAASANAQMVQVVTAALATKQEPPNILGQLAPIISAAAPLLGRLVEPRGPIASVKDVLDVIQHAKSLGDGGGGEGSGGGEWGGILQAIGAFAQRAAASPAPGVQVDTATPAASQIAAIPAANGQPEDMNAILSTYAKAVLLPRLTRAAQRESDPASYADVLLDELEQLPPAYVSAVTEALKDVNWRNRLFGQNPLPYDPWFVELREQLLDDGKESAEEVPIAIAKP